jgi:hypothetical protein
MSARDAGSEPDRRRLFGSDPTNYHEARPEYPERVYELLTSRCGLGPGTATLAIGPRNRPGEASIYLAQRR